MQKSPKFLVIDLFCGAGGTSTGFDRAKLNGAHLAQVIACVNHDALAIQNHRENFPDCVHFTEDVRQMNLAALKRIARHYQQKYPQAKLVLWASLECTHFSNAKTGSRDADSRTLAWCLLEYERVLKPDLIWIENVREFLSWGPLTGQVKGKLGKPGAYCPLTVGKDGRLHGTMVPENRTAGVDFVQWRDAMEARGYHYDHRLLNSADFGSHQKRLRYFGAFVSKSSGLPMFFPVPTHDEKGANGLPRWKPVREVLDLQKPGKSIFGRKKPLSPNTLERILAGLVKFVAKPAAESFLVKNYGGEVQHRVASLDKPHPTITCRPHEMLVQTEPVGYLVKSYGGEPQHRVLPLDKPHPTVTTSPNSALVSARFMIQYNGPVKYSHFGLTAPCHTITTRDSFGLVEPVCLDRQFGTGVAQSLEKPCNTLTTVDKNNLVSVRRVPGWLLTNMHHNRGTSLEKPAPTLLTGTHHYLLNPQYHNDGNSIDKPCCTLIARMGKRPLSLVQAEAISEPAPTVPLTYYEQRDVPVWDRIYTFMREYGLADILMRMLSVKELKKIQGLTAEGEREFVLTGSQEEQKKFIGNAVVPHVVTAWVEQYFTHWKGTRKSMRMDQQQLKLQFAA